MDYLGGTPNPTHSHQSSPHPSTWITWAEPPTPLLLAALSVPMLAVGHQASTVVIAAKNGTLYVTLLSDEPVIIITIINNIDIIRGPFE